MIPSDIPLPAEEQTPEERAFIARRTLTAAVKVMCLCARGCGVTDDRIKIAVLMLRDERIAFLTDDEAQMLISQLGLNGA